MQAVLTGGPKASADGSCQRQLQVSIGHHNDRRIAAQLHAHFFQANFTHNGFAHIGAAGEGDHSHPGIADQHIANLAAWAGNDLQHGGRKPGLMQRFAQHQGAERRFGIRLDNDGVAAGNGRANLVRHQVQRVIERGNGADDADGFAEIVSQAIFAARHLVEGDGFAVDAAGFFGADADGFDAAGHFFARFADGFDALLGDGARVSFVFGKQNIGCFVQNTHSLVNRHFSGALRARNRRANGLPHIFYAGLGNKVNQAVVLRITHFKLLWAINPFSIK